MGNKDRKQTRDSLGQAVYAGTKLFNDILTKVHKGNLDEMHSFLSSHIEKLDLYGDTKDKQIINYCSFKRDVILHIYS